MGSRKVLLGLTSALLSSSIATAGDMGKTVAPDARFHTVVSVHGGAGFINIHNRSQTYIGTDDVFTYFPAKHSTSSALGGAFLGFEHALPNPNLYMQAGIEYTAYGRTQIHGLNTVGIEPSTSTAYDYHYGIQSQQLLAVGKLFTTVHQIYHPYLSAGIGSSFNHSDKFSLNTQETGSINLAPSFNSHSTTKLSYSVGLGIDRTLTNHVRLGLGYRFSGLGNSSLGEGIVGINHYQSPTGITLSTSNLYVNEVIAQISYVS